MSYTGYPPNFLKLNELTNLSNLNARTSKVCLTYFCISTILMSWCNRILRRKDCFVHLGCGSPSATAKVISHNLSPLSLLPASSTPTRATPFYNPVLAHVYLDTSQVSLHTCHFNFRSEGLLHFLSEDEIKIFCNKATLPTIILRQVSGHQHYGL